MRVHFKHLYGPDVPSWGIIGFTKAQPAAAALRNYRNGEIVLLAVPNQPGREMGGMIFGRCTLLRWDARTDQLANPEMADASPEVLARWPTATPIHKYWRAEEPIHYAKFPSLSRAAMLGRGRMFEVDDVGALDWFRTATWLEEEVYHCARVKDAMRLTSVG